MPAVRRFRTVVAAIVLVIALYQLIYTSTKSRGVFRDNIRSISSTVKHERTSNGTVHQQQNGDVVNDQSLLGALFKQRHTLPPLLEPIAAFRDWKHYHSADALRRSPHNRTFILKEYSCPRQVGVILNDFLSAILHAVVTNRTFLYRYKQSSRNQTGENECDQFLQRSTWLPSYEEWKERLHLPEPHYMVHGTGMDKNHPTIQIERMDRGERVHADISAHPVIVPERLWGVGKERQVWPGLLLLTDKYTLRYLKQTYGHECDEARLAQLIPRLYREGASFLYGMLFAETFSFPNRLWQSVQEDLTENEGSTTTSIHSSPEFSIALHSRHPKDIVDGKDVSQEKACIDQILALRPKQHAWWRRWLGRTNPNVRQPCVLYLMADRQTTLDQLAAYGQSKGCRVVQVTGRRRKNHSETTAYPLEHGPFAGAGYFQDWLVVSQARSAIVSTRRSSSALVDERMEYLRRFDAWREKPRRWTGMEPILRCNMGRPFHPPRGKIHKWRKKAQRQIDKWFLGKG